MRTWVLILILLVSCSCSKTTPVESDVTVSSPARFCQTPIPLPVTVGRGVNPVNRVGCFQKKALEDSDGYSYVVIATDNQAGGVLRLAVFKSVQSGKDWTTAPQYALAGETTIANGYSADSILNLREFSADIRESKIHIAFIYDTGGAAYGTRYITFDIVANTFKVVGAAFLATVLDGTADSPTSVDISCQESGCLRDINKRDVGAGTIWVATTNAANFDPTLNAASLTIYTEFIADASLFGFIYECVGYAYHLFGGVNPTGFSSIFDGGSEIYSTLSYAPSTAGNYYLLYTWQDFLSKTTDFTNNFYYVFNPNIISGAVDVSSILYDFGCWDACYVDAYNLQVQAKWLRNAGGTGWDLYVGFRNQNGFVNAYLALSIDYAALGVANIETELENNDIFPETVISVSEAGTIYVYALYPDPRNAPIGSTGPGSIDDNPYTTIKLLTIEGDSIYSSQNLDWQMAWDGIQNTSRKIHISAPHRTDSQDLDSADVHLFFTVYNPLEVVEEDRETVHYRS